MTSPKIQNNISNFDSSSLPSMLTDPLPTERQSTEQADDRSSLALNIEQEEEPGLALQASTSHSVEHLNRRPRGRGDASHQHRHPSKKGRKRRRIHSDTDLRQMRYFLVIIDLKLQKNLSVH